MGKERLIITSGGRRILLDPGEIVFIEVLDHHLIIHCRQRIITVRHSLKDVEKLLPGRGFCRIHRSFLVSLKFVYQYGRDYVVMNDGKDTHLPVGSRYRDAFAEALSL